MHWEAAKPLLFTQAISLICQPPRELGRAKWMKIGSLAPNSFVKLLTPSTTLIFLVFIKDLLEKLFLHYNSISNLIFGFFKLEAHNLLSIITGFSIPPQTLPFCCCCHLSQARLFEFELHQISLSISFSQECWSRLPRSPRDLPDPGGWPLCLLALANRFFNISTTGEALLSAGLCIFLFQLSPPSPFLYLLFPLSCSLRE